MSSEKESQKQKGWTQEGIERFNTLFAGVKKDRVNRQKFDTRLIGHLRASQDKRKGSKKRKYTTTLAAHSLWEQDKPDGDDTDNENSDSMDSNDGANSNGGGHDSSGGTEI